MSAVGGLASAGAQKRAEVEKYKRELKLREIDWDGTRNEYARNTIEMQEQVDENFLAASRGYAAEQTQLNDIFNQATVAFQDDFVKLMEAQKFMGSGATARRLEGRNLAAFGRSQALTASNLVRARESYDSDVGSLRRQLLEANRKAYAPVKFKPIPGLAPIKPDTDMTGANLAFMGSMAGTAATGLEGYAKMNDGRMPWSPKPKAPKSKPKAPKSRANEAGWPGNQNY